LREDAGSPGLLEYTAKLTASTSNPACETNARTPDGDFLRDAVTPVKIKCCTLFVT
jgi:hypothetical protein